jgi:hypothetical protein
VLCSLLLASLSTVTLAQIPVQPRRFRVQPLNDRLTCFALSPRRQHVHLYRQPGEHIAGSQGKAGGQAARHGKCIVSFERCRAALQALTADRRFLRVLSRNSTNRSNVPGVVCILFQAHRHLGFCGCIGDDLLLKADHGHVPCHFWAFGDGVRQRNFARIVERCPQPIHLFRTHIWPETYGKQNLLGTAQEEGSRRPRH